MNDGNAHEVDPDDDGSTLVRFGTTVGVAFVVAVIGTAPAAIRLANDLPADVGGLFSAWTVLGASALVPAILLVAIFRGARHGARSFTAERALEHGTRLFAFACVLPPVLVVFASILRAKTHHHALAGVTYSIVVLLVLVAVAATATRAASLVSSWGPRAARVGFGLSFVAFLGSMAWAGIAAQRAGGSYAGAFLDVLALLLAAGFGSRRDFVDLRPFAVVGPPLAAILLALGITTVKELQKPLVEARADVVVYSPVLDHFTGR